MADPLSGQITIDGSVQVWSLAVTRQMNNVYLSVPATNSGPVYIGNDGSDSLSTSNGFALSTTGLAGISVPASVLRRLRIKGTNNDKLHWLVVG
jgi:hypothetical protein